MNQKLFDYLKYTGYTDSIDIDLIERLVMDDKGDKQAIEFAEWKDSLGWNIRSTVEHKYVKLSKNGYLYKSSTELLTQFKNKDK
jgi:hypothetical protein